VTQLQKFLNDFKAREVKCLVIGASAGGVEVLGKILPALKAEANFAVCLVLHIPPTAPNLIPEIFRETCGFRIKEAESSESILPGYLYVAPPNYHMSIDKDFTLALSNEEAVNYSRPSIDVLFDSSAIAYKSNVVGILLTGSNHDGAQGLKKIQELGGLTITEDPATANFPQMPQAAIAIMKPDLILSADKIAALMKQL
jgi:two-component system chemotaxis response regulator CheB